ncbi:MAG: EVE domain-containing protein [Pseudomonadota bacterium]|nr:EVE domain-containing protein [Pseudomonadota bacterium]
MAAYWLMKTEPTTFGIDHLRERGIEPWDGVRNYQARNMIRDQMQPGDGALIYHSNCTVPAIVGLARISSVAYPDPTAFNPESRYYDPASTPERPRWYVVDVAYERHLCRPLPLAELRTYPELEGMALLRRGNRLSITPISPNHWEFLLELAGAV